MQRVAKAISSSGLCSRRDAERLIIEGKVKVNGFALSTPAINVRYEDIIEVDGKKIARGAQPRLWLYHKPVGLITTHKDPENRPTVFDNLPKSLPQGIISVGRLDINSEGLLLLTNSGDLARKLELPSSKLSRIYLVRAHGDASKVDLKRKRIIIESVIYNLRSIKLKSRSQHNSWFEVELQEGKNREIRKIFSFFGLQVNRLIRIKYGPYILGDIRPGECEEVKLNCP